MPSSKKRPALKGEIIGRDRRLRASTIAAMPGKPLEDDKRNYPEVWINGTHYVWTPGDEDGIPEEALAVWRASLEANS